LAGSFDLSLAWSLLLFLKTSDHTTDAPSRIN